MSTHLTLPDEQLIEIPSPHLEPRFAFPAMEPRKVDNLTLIDGKTFSATNVAGDIHPAGSPDVGFFHDDTRFLSHLELRIGGHRADGAVVQHGENIFLADRADHRQHYAARFL